MQDKVFSFVFYRIKNEKKFLENVYSIDNGLKFLLNTIVEYKSLKNEKIKLMKKINQNNKEITNLLNTLKNLLPDITLISSVEEKISEEVKEMAEVKERETDITEEEINIEKIKEELKKIEEDLLKLNIG